MKRSLIWKRIDDMFRRNAILLACSAVPAICLPAVVAPAVTTEADDDREQAEVDELAQTLADIEFAALKDDHPEDWRSVSYIADAKIDERFSAFYCVTGDERLLNLWAGRVERAMYPGKLRVYALGKAGQYPGMDNGFNHVTLFIVGREGVELERVAFADLKATYPEPMLTC